MPRFVTDAQINCCILSALITFRQGSKWFNFWFNYLSRIVCIGLINFPANNDFSYTYTDN